MENQTAEKSAEFEFCETITEISAASNIDTFLEFRAHAFDYLNVLKQELKHLISGRPFDENGHRQEKEVNKKKTEIADFKKKYHKLNFPENPPTAELLTLRDLYAVQNLSQAKEDQMKFFDDEPICNDCAEDNTIKTLINIERTMGILCASYQDHLFHENKLCDPNVTEKLPIDDIPIDEKIAETLGL
jgi:hypothetical protein